MTRVELTEQVEEAEVQASQGDSRIRAQQHFIDELASAGHDTTPGKRGIRRFVSSQAMHISVRNHVRADLEAFDNQFSHPLQ